MSTSEECKTCPHKGFCMLMEALLEMSKEHQQWWDREVVPELKRADQLLGELRQK